MSGLHGKVAVVTGGTSGIGLAITQRFVKEGAHVFITGRRQSELDKAKALIGGSVTAVRGDATSTADLDRLFQTVKAEKGKLDILVANSGRVEPEEFGKITEDNFDKTFDLNARAAVRSYARTWTQEFQDRGIRINTLSPGPIDTPIMDGQADTKEGADAIRAAFASVIPPDEWANPRKSPPPRTSWPPTRAASWPASTWPSTAAWPRSRSKRSEPQRARARPGGQLRSHRRSLDTGRFAMAPFPGVSRQNGAGNPDPVLEPAAPSEA